VHPDEGSWGSGKDFRVWTSQNTTDLRDSQERATRRVRDELENLDPLVRHHRADQLTTSLLLGLASDWIFMVEKDSAADYARARLRDHLSDVDRILNDPSDKTWRDIAERDRPYGHVDARAFLTPSR
jgi:1,4-alpha-glucan branching enzyme